MQKLEKHLKWGADSATYSIGQVVDRVDCSVKLSLPLARALIGQLVSRKSVRLEWSEMESMHHRNVGESM